MSNIRPVADPRLLRWLTAAFTDIARWKAVGGHAVLRLAFDADLAAALERAAVRRGLSVPALAHALIAAVVRDDLVVAVLDDGDEERPLA